jgi:hypothetical protein
MPTHIVAFVTTVALLALLPGANNAATWPCSVAVSQ